MKISRRKFLGLGVLSFVGFHLGLSAHTISQTFSIEPNIDGTFDLPNLPYSYNALNQAIDTETMTIHHQKHHKAYVDKLNTTLAKMPNMQRKSLETILMNINSIPKEFQTAMRNNGGGHYNHSFFWKVLSPNKQIPSKKVQKAIDKNFQSLDNFKTQFKTAALGLFGSGWVFLLEKADKSLVIRTFQNQDNFLMYSEYANEKPLLALDVWEHAYYLRYQNQRASYIDKYFEIINWEFVENQLKSK